MAIPSPRKLTYEDFVHFPDDGQRHEILNGVHVVSPAPKRSHQKVSNATFVSLYTFVRAHGLGEVYDAPYDVRLSEHDVFEPDILYVSSNRLAILTEDYVQGAPDLVVEVLSPSTRRHDLGEKRARYELLGIGEYWILDPESATAQVLRRLGNRFLPPLLLSAEDGDLLTTPLLPGLEISLREVFAR